MTVQRFAIPTKTNGAEQAALLRLMPSAVPSTIFLVLLCLLMPAALADSPEQPTRAPVIAQARQLQDLVQRMENRYRALESFRAEFVQTYESASFGSEEQHVGTLHVGDGRMLWEYEQPEGQRAVYDGESWWLVIPEDREVHRRMRRADQPEPLTDLLSGRLDLLSVFSARPSGEPATIENGVVLELLPREPRDDLELALLELDRRRGDLRRLELFDPLGNRMVFRLGKTKKQPALSPDRFNVDVPEDFTLLVE